MLQRCVLFPCSSAASAIIARAAVIPQKMIWIPSGWVGRLDGGGRALRAVVFNVSVNVTEVLPGVTAAIGLGEMVESAGRPETVKFTAFSKPSASIGPTVTLIIVDCPAVMVVGFADMVAPKSSAVKVSCCVLAPPPGAGFVTVTFGVPPAVMSEAGTLTMIGVGVTEAESGVIAAFEPNVTPLTPLTKPVPVIVNWNAAPPATALVDESEVTVGNGLLMVKGKVPESPPPGAGLLTKTLIVAPVAMSVAGICTVIAVAVIEAGTKPVNVP